jgi:predicted nucleic acid-binding protein
VKWIDSLQGTIVGLDMASLIYFMEEHPVWLPVVRPFFEALDQGQFQAVTSTVTLTEVLVYPLRQSQFALAEQYREILLGARNLATVPVTVAIAEQAAALRAQYRLRTPDAIQIATAMRGNATSFLTNDRKLSAPETLRIITLDTPSRGLV